MRTQMRTRLWMFISALVWMVARPLQPMLSQEARHVQVVDFDARLDHDAAIKARAAFENGDIVRIIGTSEADVVQVFGSRLGSFEVLNRQSRRSIAGFPSNPKGAIRLALQAVAGYKDANGIVHTVQSFAPAADDSTDNETHGFGNSARGGWQKHLDDWITDEQEKIVQGIGDDPGPPQKAWTALDTSTVQAVSTYGNFEQSTVAVYRANTTNPDTDYYMVYTVPEVRPVFGGCNGFSVCGWHTIARSFLTKATEATALFDHGPTGTITGGSVGFTLAGNFSPSPGVSGGFTSTWSQPSVTTIDGSTGTYGKWDEQFNLGIVPCDPTGGNVPPVSAGTFLSRQGAIFEVPGGTTKFDTSVKADAHFCSYGVVSGFDAEDSLSIQTNLTLGPPTLFASPTSLTIPAGQSATLLVSAFIPGSSQGFVWNVSTNHATSWLTVPTNGPFSAGQAIQVSVAPNTPDGSTGTISIDSAPPFATPSVVPTSIQIPVTVGTPKTQNSEGVLLMGGVNLSGSTAATPEVFDTTTQAVAPTAPPIFAPLYHTATLLGDGDILIAGGTIKVGSNQVATNAVQLFHPTTKTFTPAGSMNTARSGHTATLLPDGKVLITGGADAEGHLLASAELYNPVTGTFTPTGSMQYARTNHTASFISQPGKPAEVMVYAGNDGDLTIPRLAEIWNEASGTFSATGTQMPIYQIGFPQPLRNSSGYFEITGGTGSDSRTLQHETLLDPNAPTFRNGITLKVARSSHTLTALPSPPASLYSLIAIGGVQYTGGADLRTLGSAEIRDGNGWTLLSGTSPCPGNTGCLLTPRSQHTATLLPSGDIFVAGGSDSNQAPLGSTEFYHPDTKNFTSGPIISPRSAHTATAFATSTTVLNVSPNPSTAGQEVTMAASVTALTSTPVGSVQFLDGSTVLRTVPLNNGQATFSTSTLTVGQHSLTAVYSGNGIPGASQSKVVTQTVNTANTTVSVSSSPNPSLVGEVVKFSALVRPTPDGGSVTFKDGTVTLGMSPVVDGVANFSTSTLSLGLHAITAVFSGNGRENGSTSPVFTQTVETATSQITLTSSLTTSGYGQPVIFSTTVSSSSGTPSGKVTFYDGTIPLRTALLRGGAAHITVKTLTVGAHSITAIYSGNATFRPATSSPLTLVVNSAKTTVTVSSSKNPSGPGQHFVLTAIISTPYGTPTGTITFRDTSQTLGVSKVVNGKATLRTYYVIPGTRYITAEYSGDAGYTGSTSSPYAQQVNVTK